MINKYFGEIKVHGEVATRTAQIPTLDKTIKLYHEDNFANVKTGMIAEHSVPAGVKEENISEASQVEIASAGVDKIEKSPTTINRTAEPPAGKAPEVTQPSIWKATLANGIRVYGIQNKELPLVELSLVLDGGVLQDKTNLPGVAGMVASVLPQGTKNLTPEELEEQTELLGSNINMSAGSEEMTIRSSALSRNFYKTAGLLKEIILEPRWDTLYNPFECVTI